MEEMERNNKEKADTKGERYEKEILQQGDDILAEIEAIDAEEGAVGGDIMKQVVHQILESKGVENDEEDVGDGLLDFAKTLLSKMMDEPPK